MVFRMPKAMSGSRIRPLPARLGALAFTPPAFGSPGGISKMAKGSVEGFVLRTDARRRGQPHQWVRPVGLTYGL